MAEEKKFPTPTTPKAQEEKLSPEKKKAILNDFEKKLGKYYANRLPIETMRKLAEAEQDE